MRQNGKYSQKYQCQERSRAIKKELRSNFIEYFIYSFFHGFACILVSGKDVATGVCVCPIILKFNVRQTLDVQE